MRLFKIPNGQIDDQTRATVLTPPFDMNIGPETGPPTVGRTSMLAPWLGNAGIPPVVGAPGTAGYSSLLAFWMGGGSYDTEPLVVPLADAGRDGIGVVQPRSGVNYPFVSPSVEIRHLFADFHLAYRDRADYDSDATPWALPFKIAWVYGLGEVSSELPDFAQLPLHAVDLIVMDANDEIVFDSVNADNFFDDLAYYDSRDWGTRFRMYEWRTATAVCRLVTFTSWPEFGSPEPVEYYEHIVPTDGVLDARTLQRDPKRVTSITALLTHLSRKSISIKNGYNLTLTDLGSSNTIGGRNVRRIEIAAVPGSGRGQFPGCTSEDLFVRSINGSVPTAGGDFWIKATDCYWVRQPITITSESPRYSTPTRDVTPSAADLQFGNDCGPCCSCDDYVAEALRLNALRDEYAALGAIVTEAAEGYHTNRLRWLEQKACHELHPLQVALQPQNCPSIDVAVRFCNQTDQCRQNIVLYLDFEALPEIAPGADLTNTDCDDPPNELPVYGGDPPVEVGCRRTFITTSVPRRTSRYTLQGKWPSYRALFEGINPYESVEVRFRLEFPNNGVGVAVDLTEAAYLVVLQATATENGENICDNDGNKISLKKSASLECPADTLEAC